MILDRFKPSDRDTWTWKLGEIWDVDDIMAMVHDYYREEIDPIFEFNQKCFATNIAKATLDQRYDGRRCQIIVAREQETDRLLAWSWLNRGYYPPYTEDEVAEAAFVHMDLTRPLMTRMRLLAQVLQQWELWCAICQIPVLISTSIRGDQEGFIRMHHLAGYRTRGSFAFKRFGESK